MASPGRTTQIYKPDGERFATFLEMMQRIEQERHAKEVVVAPAEQERHAKEAAVVRAQQEQRDKEAALPEAECLVARLRALGITPHHNRAGPCRPTRSAN